jgi:hypothetical protein
MDIDRLELEFGRTLTKIGELKELVLYADNNRIQVEFDLLEALENETLRAVALAEYLGLEYDDMYDC